MRTWRSPMSAASQGAFVVIPEISLCDISYIMTKPRSDTRPVTFIVPQVKPQSYNFILLPSRFLLLILSSFCTRTGTASARSSPRACRSCRKHESELCRSTSCPACLLYWCRSSFSSWQPLCSLPPSSLNDRNGTAPYSPRPQADWNGFISWNVE